MGRKFRDNRNLFTAGTFLSEVNNRETKAIIEATNGTYCLQKRIQKFPLVFEDNKNVITGRFSLQCFSFNQLETCEVIASVISLTCVQQYRLNCVHVQWDFFLPHVTITWVDRDLIFRKLH